MKISPLASAISLMLTSLAMPGVSLAQEEDAGAHRGLEQIIVQARRVEENVQDVPLAITAMSAEQLEKAGISQVADLVQAAPSVQMSTAVGRPEAAFFAIRGQRSDDILLTSDQAVAVIISGAPVNWAYGVGLMGTLDVSSLEVAKGPQGTLFGKNSTGGAIIITPAEPDKEFGGKIRAGVGNYNMRELEGMINVPLTDTLSGRVAAQATKRDGWAKNENAGDDFNSTDNWTARASLKWEPTDTLSSLFVFEGGYASSSSPLTKVTATNPTFGLGPLYALAIAKYDDSFWEGRTDSAHGGYSDMKTWGVLNTTTFEISPEITIKNIAGVRDLDYESLLDNDGVYAGDLCIPGVTCGIKFQSLQFTAAQSVTEELQIIGSYDIADWIAGLYYSHTDGNDGSDSIQFNPVGNVGITGPAGGVVNQTIAAFGQSTWHLTDKLNLTTGLRFTMDDREVTYISRNLANPPFQAETCLLSIPVTDAAGNPVKVNGSDPAPAGCRLTKNENFHEPTWNLSLDYKLTDSQLVYIANRHGYRSGGFPGRGQTAVTTAPFDPEKVTDYEIGYKVESDVAGMPFRLNTAAFYQDYKDIQRNITLIDGATLSTAVRNAASGTVQGAELEFTILPFDSLELTGYYSYVDASYDSWEDNGIDRSSNLFPSIPENSAGLTARYTLPLPTNIGEVALSANVYWQDDTAGYVDNKVDGSGNECKGSMIDSYHVYNARVDWDAVMGIDGFSLNAWGKNLANEEYYSSSLCLYNLVGFSVQYPAEPRTYGISAQYKF